MLGEGPGMLLQHFLLLFGRVFVLESKELTARLQVHSLDEVGSLGGAETHQGVDVHVVGSGQHLEQLVVGQLVDKLEPPSIS